MISFKENRNHKDLVIKNYGDRQTLFYVRNPGGSTKQVKGEDLSYGI